MKIKASYYYDIPSQDLISLYHEKEFVKVRCQMPGILGYELDEFGEIDGKFVISFKAEVVIPIPDKLPRFLVKRIKDKHTFVSSIAIVGKRVSALMGSDIKRGLEDEYKATLLYIDQYYDRKSAQSRFS
ncbi:MAG: hypothetical protein JKY67_07100 [Pseudomonadales bacterium]|nr:hypothetical protein [Pseudomonadales bacterium]